MAKDYITLNEVPFYGHFTLSEYGTDTILHDSRKDGGDVPPLLCLAPVTAITIVDGIFRIEIMTEWKEC